MTIGFGGILANIPGAEIATGDGLLRLIYKVGIETAAFPLIIFMGVGALTDFRPMLANPKTLLLGAAAQFGIFGTLLGALGLTALGVMDFDLREAAAIAIIGGADGPTAIYVAGRLAPDLLGAVARGGLFLHGVGAPDSAAHRPRPDQRAGAGHRDGAVTGGQ